MTTLAPDSDKLKELDDETRQAWRSYSEKLQSLKGVEYEQAEDESWAQLQSELRLVERRRRSLTQNST